MHPAPDAVADVVGQDAVVALREDVVLDRLADLVEVAGRDASRAMPRHSDCSVTSESVLPLGDHLRAGSGRAARSVRAASPFQPSRIGPAVDRDDVAGLQDARHRGCRARPRRSPRRRWCGGSPCSSLKFGVPPARDDRPLGERVELERRDTRPRCAAAHRVERRRRRQTGRHHQPELRGRLVDRPPEDHRMRSTPPTRSRAPTGRMPRSARAA